MRISDWSSDVCSSDLAEWPVNERPPLYVHRGVVSTLRVDGPLQDAGRTYLPLGGLIDTPFVPAHLDPVEDQRLDSQVQEAIEQTIDDWICEHLPYHRPRSRREIDHPQPAQPPPPAISPSTAQPTSTPPTT